MESLIALPFLANLIFEKATGETRVFHYLLTSPYDCTVNAFGRAVTGAQQAQTTPYPLNTIKSCISFTWTQ